MRGRAFKCFLKITFIVVLYVDIEFNTRTTKMVKLTNMWFLLDISQRCVFRYLNDFSWNVWIKARALRCIAKSSIIFLLLWRFWWKFYVFIAGSSSVKLYTKVKFLLLRTRAIIIAASVIWKSIEICRIEFFYRFISTPGQMQFRKNERFGCACKKYHSSSNIYVVVCLSAYLAFRHTATWKSENFPPGKTGIVSLYARVYTTKLHSRGFLKLDAANQRKGSTSFPGRLAATVLRRLFSVLYFFFFFFPPPSLSFTECPDKTCFMPRDSAFAIKRGRVWNHCSVVVSSFLFFLPFSSAGMTFENPLFFEKRDWVIVNQFSRRLLL